MANRVRIINKTKTGCTLDFKGSIGQKVVTWEEFNKIYVIKDNVWAEVNPEFEKLDQKVNDLVTLCLTVKQDKDPEVVSRHEYMIGELSTTLCAELKCTLSELMEVVKKRASLIKTPAPKSRKKPKKPVVVSSSGSAKGNTFGDLDVLKELKAKMEADKKKNRKEK